MNFNPRDFLEKEAVRLYAELKDMQDYKEWLATNIERLKVEYRDNMQWLQSQLKTHPEMQIPTNIETYHNSVKAALFRDEKQVWIPYFELSPKDFFQKYSNLSDTLIDISKRLL
jgi:hypothetical protein